MSREKAREPAYRSGDIRRLVESCGADLTEDERALLLVLIEVDEETLDEQDRAALAELREQVHDYDVKELSQAVEHMLTANPRKGKKLDWPGLRRRLKSWQKRRPSHEK
jgi:hypothetical protein